VERRIALAFTTLTIFAPPAQASHPKQAVRPEGSASPLEFVATDPAAHYAGYSFARQVVPVPAAGSTAAARSQRATPVSTRALSRVIYLNRDGVILRPGINNSARQISSIVSQPTEIYGWDIDDDTWDETVSCIAELYSPFDVAVTDRDPRGAAHIEVVFGGSPEDVGLPENVAGVSPFTTDCSIIENSIVFAFTDVLPEDPRLICEVTAQEIAHSFGLDHEMLASDPMSYLDYAGDRKFRDRTASCGEYADRECGINGMMCRERQNSVALLRERLGARGTGATDGNGALDQDPAGTPGGCMAAGGTPGAMALAVLVMLRRRRRR
jgi:MYXO-CTERM domain-containing protein